MSYPRWASVRTAAFTACQRVYNYFSQVAASRDLRPRSRLEKMNVHVSYKVQKTPDIEKEISHQIEKIQKRLHVFRPELVHLKAIVDQNSAREGMLVSLNLRLPSGQLTAQAKAPS